MRKRILTMAAGLLIITGCNLDTTEEVLKSENVKKVDYSLKEKDSITIINETPDQPNESMEEDVTSTPENNGNNEEEQTELNDDAIVVENPHAIDVVVNKQRKLPKGFVPNNLVEPNVDFNAAEGNPKRLMRQEAALALEELFAVAKENGFDLVAQSGYRSIDRQITLYNYYVENYGQDWADQYSAVPGHSEHHTGLAMDITSAVVSMKLVEEFGGTDAGQWVAEHAHEFGFVIRYPKGKSEITGYSYEPWHLRYFGKELATQIYESGLTVEEFFGYVN